MSAENEIEVFETPTFRKIFKKLSESQKVLVENEIDKIIDNPDIGEQKKNNLSYLWVHKFKINNQLTLLGYSWNKSKLELFLLNISSHENFYKDADKRRKADIKIIR